VNITGTKKGCIMK